MHYVANNACVCNISTLQYCRPFRKQRTIRLEPGIVEISSLTVHELNRSMDNAGTEIGPIERMTVV